MFLLLQVFRTLRELNIPVVVDADGLYILNKNLWLVKGYKNAILTPNKAEFGRLAAALNIDLEKSGKSETNICFASSFL